MAEPAPNFSTTSIASAGEGVQCSACVKYMTLLPPAVDHHVMLCVDFVAGLLTTLQAKRAPPNDRTEAKSLTFATLQDAAADLAFVVEGRETAKRAVT